MGTFEIKFFVLKARGSGESAVRALVDTGSTYTWLPATFLHRLGHKPTVKRSLKLADGRIVEKDAGDVPVRIDGETLNTLCIFSDQSDEALLGAVTLEAFSLAPDPVNKRLIKVVALAKNTRG